MTANATDSATDADAFFDETLPEAGLIQTALCYLMTRYTLRPCFGLVCTIVHHLQMLLAHPDMAGLPERRKVYYGLLQDWKRIAEHAQAACCKGVVHQQGAVH
jgi:hypothetical protein